MNLNLQQSAVIFAIMLVIVVGAICYFHSSYKCDGYHKERRMTCQSMANQMDCREYLIDVCDGWSGR